MKKNRFQPQIECLESRTLLNGALVAEGGQTDTFHVSVDQKVDVIVRVEGPQAPTVVDAAGNPVFFMNGQSGRLVHTQTFKLSPGDYQITAPGQSKLSVGLRSDADGDGDVDSNDVSFVNGLQRGTRGRLSTPFTLGNPNLDGRLDGNDLRIIKGDIGQSLSHVTLEAVPKRDKFFAAPAGSNAKPAAVPEDGVSSGNSIGSSGTVASPAAGTNDSAGSPKPSSNEPAPQGNGSTAPAGNTEKGADADTPVKSDSSSTRSDLGEAFAVFLRTRLGGAGGDEERSAREGQIDNRETNLLQASDSFIADSAEQASSGGFLASGVQGLKLSLGNQLRVPIPLNKTAVDAVFQQNEAAQRDSLSAVPGSGLRLNVGPSVTKALSGFGLPGNGGFGTSVRTTVATVRPAPSNLTPRSKSALRSPQSVKAQLRAAPRPGNTLLKAGVSRL